MFDILIYRLPASWWAPFSSLQNLATPTPQCTALYDIQSSAVTQNQTFRTPKLFPPQRDVDALWTARFDDFVLECSLSLQGAYFLGLRPTGGYNTVLPRRLFSSRLHSGAALLSRLL